MAEIRGRAGLVGIQALLPQRLGDDLRDISVHMLLARRDVDGDVAEVDGRRRGRAGMGAVAGREAGGAAPGSRRRPASAASPAAVGRWRGPQRAGPPTGVLSAAYSR